MLSRGLRRAMLFGLAAILLASCSGDDDGGTVPTGTAATAATETVDDGPWDIVYEARAGSTTDVWTINPVTGESTQVTNDGGVSSHPAWSPDRSRIIYVSDRDVRPKRNVYTVNPDGSDVQRLTTAANVDHWSPKYSPDSMQITYVEVVPGEGSYLTLMDADGSNQRRLTEAYRFLEFPAWTRDGEEIYFAAIEVGGGDIDIFAVDVATKAVTTIVSTPAADVCPHFTRDGKILTYASSAPDDSSNTDLFARELPFDSHTDIGDDKRLTTDPGFDDYSNTSPDDKQFVYLSRRDGNAELYLMDADGENETRLTNTPDVDENVPDW